MRLLIVTQIVDTEDPVLGFFCDWIQAFSQTAETVEVICLKEGAHTFSRGVRVHSLGKEAGTTRLERVRRFYRLLYTLRDEYDAVFVHMNPEYVILGGLLWRLWGKRVGLWYTHKSVTVALRFATYLTHRIYTASKESFRITTSKTCVTGHGIPHISYGSHRIHEPLRLLSVGRMSRIKHYEDMVTLLELLVARGVSSVLTIVGDTITADEEVYVQSLVHRAEEKKLPVICKKGIAYREIPALLKEHDIFLNFSDTGSLDKTILEAWASGLFVVTTNEGVRSIAVHVDVALPYKKDMDGLIGAVDAWMRKTEKERDEYRMRAYEYVLSSHGLERTIGSIVRDLAG